jgi:hypothetical protein
MEIFKYVWKHWKQLPSDNIIKFMKTYMVDKKRRGNKCF